MAFSSSFIRRSYLLFTSIYLVSLLNINSFDFTNDVASHNSSLHSRDFEQANNVSSGNLTKSRGSQFAAPKRSDRANSILKNLAVMISTIAIAILIVRCIRYIKPSKHSLKYRRLSEHSPCQDMESEGDSTDSPTTSNKDSLDKAENTSDERETEENTIDPLRESLLAGSEVSVKYTARNSTCDASSDGNSNKHVVISLADETENSNKLIRGSVGKESSKHKAKTRKAILIAVGAAVTAAVIVALAVQLSEAEMTNTEILDANLQLNVDKLDLEMQNAEMNETINLLDDEIDKLDYDLNAAYRKLEQTQTILEKTDAMVEQLQSQLADGAREQTRLIEQSAAEKAELSEINNELSVENDLQIERTSNLTEKYNNLEAKAMSLEEDIKKLHEDVANLELKNTALETKNTALETKNTALRLQNEALKISKDFHDSFSHQLERLDELRKDVDTAWLQILRMQDIAKATEDLVKKEADVTFYLRKDPTIILLKEINPSEVQMVQEMPSPALLKKYKDAFKVLKDQTWTQHTALLNQIIATDMNDINTNINRFFSIFSDTFNNQNFAAFKGETESVMPTVMAYMRDLTKHDHTEAKPILREIRRFLHKYLNIARPVWE